MTTRTAQASARDRTALASFLTTLHWIHGPAWSELSRRTGLSVSTLQRTARRTGPVPREENVIAYVEGITRDPRAVTDALRLWRRARIEERGRLRTLNAPAPAFVRNHADLLAALAAAYEKAGAPPLRTLQRRAGNAANNVPHLPLTNAFRIINRERLPTDQRQYEAYLAGCGVPEHALTPWRNAWIRVQSTVPTAPVTPEEHPFAPLARHLISQRRARAPQAP
ncbi:hypothetical protein ACF09G_36340 [Streptomyces albogriseolus]|uniref:hypothetical protein n=1 Tax=Streptomyces albogriseolus TaxID=1887 RepID=UPI00199E6A66|nr:hypothetical protein [Streptomyces sp.]